MHHEHCQAALHIIAGQLSEEKIKAVHLLDVWHRQIPQTNSRIKPYQGPKAFWGPTWHTRARVASRWGERGLDTPPHIPHTFPVSVCFCFPRNR